MARKHRYGLREVDRAAAAHRHDDVRGRIAAEGDRPIHQLRRREGRDPVEERDALPAEHLEHLVENAGGPEAAPPGDEECTGLCASQVRNDRREVGQPAVAEYDPRGVEPRERGSLTALRCSYGVPLCSGFEDSRPAAQHLESRLPRICLKGLTAGCDCVTRGGDAPDPDQPGNCSDSMRVRQL